MILQATTAFEDQTAFITDHQIFNQFRKVRQSSQIPNAHLEHTQRSLLTLLLIQMDKQKIETLNKESIISVITSILNQILSQTQHIANQTKTIFHVHTPPSVTVGDYLKRISKYAHCSESAYIISLIYLDRLQERNQTFIMNNNCIHRLLITSVMLAAKFFDDFYYKNQYYAKVGGISKTQINLLEKDFLQMVNYDLFITPELFWAYQDKLLSFNAVNS